MKKYLVTVTKNLEDALNNPPYEEFYELHSWNGDSYLVYTIVWEKKVKLPFPASTGPK